MRNVAHPYFQNCGPYVLLMRNNKCIFTSLEQIAQTLMAIKFILDSDLVVTRLTISVSTFLHRTQEFAGHDEGLMLRGRTGDSEQTS